ncbi:MAG: hypothetical protein WD845_11420 [Pirellulales bacterium]
MASAPRGEVMAPVSTRVSSKVRRSSGVMRVLQMQREMAAGVAMVPGTM